MYENVSVQPLLTFNIRYVLPDNTNLWTFDSYVEMFCIEYLQNNPIYQHFIIFLTFSMKPLVYYTKTIIPLSTLNISKY